MGGGGSDASVRGARGYKHRLRLKDAENKDDQAKMSAWDRSEGGNKEMGQGLGGGIRCCRNSKWGWVGAGHDGSVGCGVEWTVASRLPSSVFWESDIFRWM